MLAKALASASASAAKVYVEDVFSTWLYTGNGSTQTITNGIDLSGKGGLTWIKSRSSGVEYHNLFDTARGAEYVLFSNTTDASASSPTRLSSFNSTGFTVGSNAATNASSATFASWTFRKAAKFFDVVTYTGTGSARTIAHNLGSAPGCIIVKRTDSSADWAVYHRSLTEDGYIFLNSTAASSVVNGFLYWNSTNPTSSVFSLGASNTVNASGGTYVAYLFAHDAGGFGDSGNDSVVKCGSFVGTGPAGGQLESLGWEPQWLLVKRADSTSDWEIYDSMRGFVNGSQVNTADDARLRANLSNAEDSWYLGWPASTGFQYDRSGTYIYIAIRRGPMKTPTDATKVFSVKATSGTNTTNFPVDMFLYAIRAGDAQNSFVASRLTGGNGLSTALTSAERADGWTGWDSNTTRGSLGGGDVEWDFRRAPGFFDVVAYTGTGSARTVSHNLGVAPELMIVKRRSDVSFWVTYSKTLGNNDWLVLNGDYGALGATVMWNTTDPTSTVFSLGGSGAGTNISGSTYIAYLFASCPGVSKVGSYTGTGTTLNVDCGFTNGARFVMIKRTDSTGDWYVWDTARGIVSGNDPYLLLNSTAAEVTNTDYIDPLSSGFQISSTAPAAINANGGSFIFLAIA